MPPGSIVQDYLDHGVATRDELQQALGFTDQYMYWLLNGFMFLTKEIADVLAEKLNRPAAFWLALDANFRRDIRQGKTIPTD